MKLTRLLSILVLSTVALFAEDNAQELKSKFGIFGNVGYNMHSADFYKVPNCPSCSPGYRDGNGTGYAFGLAYELPFSRMFALELRLSYYDFSAKLTRDENQTILQKFAPVNAMIEHTFDATLSSIGLEPMAKYQVIDNLFINAGLHIGTMITKEFSQKEEIINPRGISFYDEKGEDTGSPVRNEISGELQNTPSLYLAPLVGVSYRLPMNKQKTLLIEPELYYTLGVSKLVDNSLVSKWSANSLRFGLALKYSPKDVVPIIDKFEKFYKIDTVQIESDLITKNIIKPGIESSQKDISESDNIRLNLETISRTDTLIIAKQYKLSADVVAVGLDKDGKEIPNPIFKVEEFSMFRLEPLLNYVFFEHNSAEIPKNFITISQQSARSFMSNVLINNTTMDIYNNLLNIIGERMTKYSDAKIILIGFSSEIADEKGNNQLSQSRAESVKFYLVNNWGIEDKRISIETQHIAAIVPTTPDDIDKAQENRRVEITSNNKIILEPLQIESIQRTSNPPVVRFKPSVQSEAGIRNWTLRAVQSNNSSAEFTEFGNSTPSKAIDWVLERNQKTMPNSSDQIQYSIEVIDDKNNKIKSETKNLDIQYITLKSKKTQNIDDYTIEKFNLTLFDFDQAEIGKENIEVIEMIKSRIKPESEIEIIGYTDRTGNSEYNRSLSARRAEAVFKALNRKDATFKGIGEDILLYGNDTPEGRFYCRTVEITVKTKVK